MSFFESELERSTSGLAPAISDEIRNANGRDLEVRDGEEWLCVQVFPGTELQFMSVCLAQGIAFFVPFHVDFKNTLRPLWTNYVFCRLTIGQVKRLSHGYRVARILKPAIENDLVDHLKQFHPLSRLMPFREDDVVKFKSGALKGSLGRIVQVNPSEPTIRIAIEVLRKSLLISRGIDEVELHRDAARVLTLSSLEPIKSSIPDPISTDSAQGLDSDALNIHLDAISREFIKYLATHPNLLYEIEPRKFEMLVAELLADMGYEVELTPESRDGGRDILAAFNLPHGKILTLVECKRFNPQRKVGIDILERFLWVLDRKDKASCGLIATTSYFSPESIAIEKEFKWRLSLKDFGGISEWLDRYGTWTQSLTEALWLPNSYEVIPKEKRID